MSAAPSRREMELMATAAGSERANRPRWVVVVAVLALFGAVVYVVVSAGALAAARRDVGTSAESLATVQRRANAYRDLASRFANRAVEEDNLAVSKLQNLATGVGLDGVRVNERTDAYDARGLRNRTLTATLQNVEPGLFLSWVHQALQAEDLTGIQIKTLSLRPGNPKPGEAVGWNVDVAFDRLERRKR